MAADAERTFVCHVCVPPPEEEQQADAAAAAAAVTAPLSLPSVIDRFIADGNADASPAEVMVLRTVEECMAQELARSRQQGGSAEERAIAARAAERVRAVALPAETQPARFHAMELFARTDSPDIASLVFADDEKLTPELVAALGIDPAPQRTRRTVALFERVGLSDVLVCLALVQQSRGAMYVSYIERNEFFLEGLHDGDRGAGLSQADRDAAEKLRKALRTAAVQGVVIGCMRVAQAEGCERVFIWSCPPKKGACARCRGQQATRRRLSCPFLVRRAALCAQNSTAVLRGVCLAGVDYLLPYKKGRGNERYQSVSDKLLHDWCGTHALPAQSTRCRPHRRQAASQRLLWLSDKPHFTPRNRYYGKPSSLLNRAEALQVIAKPHSNVAPGTPDFYFRGCTHIDQAPIFEGDVAIRHFAKCRPAPAGPGQLEATSTAVLDALKKGLDEDVPYPAVRGMHSTQAAGAIDLPPGAPASWVALGVSTAVRSRKRARDLIDFRTHCVAV